jgi:hypothetical protein
MFHKKRYQINHAPAPYHLGNRSPKGFARRQTVGSEVTATGTGTGSINSHLYLLSTVTATASIVVLSFDSISRIVVSFPVTLALNENSSSGAAIGGGKFFIPLPLCLFPIEPLLIQFVVIELVDTLLSDDS